MSRALLQYLIIRDLDTMETVSSEIEYCAHAESSMANLDISETVNAQSEVVHGWCSPHPIRFVENTYYLRPFFGFPLRIYLHSTSPPVSNPFSSTTSPLEPYGSNFERIPA